MTATAKEYLSPAEFVALSTLSEATVRRRIKDGSIPTYQPGGHRTRILIPRDALERSRKAEGEPLNQLRASDHTEDCSAKTDSLLVSPNIPGPSPQWKRPSEVTKTSESHIMPKERQKERIVCDHYVWLIGKRGDVYTADGRSNDPALGRHSLGTKDYDQALTALRRLDLTMAVKAGKADRSALEQDKTDLLELGTGWNLYQTHVSRPRVTGGASPKTLKRYRPVFEKFMLFAQSRGVTCWNHVNRQLLEAYAAWLDDESYAYATEYLELTTLKQANKWFIENDHLPSNCRIVGLKMTKSEESDTYCWTPGEVAAIIAHCRRHSELHWLGDVLTTLACTGLRISELAALRWPDVDLKINVILLSDESTRAPRRKRRQIRQIKNRRSRSFPIHEDLRTILRKLPKGDGGLIFRGPRGGILKSDTVRRIVIHDVLTKLADRFPAADGDIGFIDGRLHSFRHYFCSRCANSGVPERVLMKWLGHQSSRMVRRYYHLHDEEAQRQMQKLDFVNTQEAGENRSAG